MSRASDILGASAPVWLSGKTYYQGDVVKSPADRYQPYVRTGAAGAGATDPSADPGNYTAFGARGIKSIQRGVISVTFTGGVATATISAVNVAKTELRYLGITGTLNARLTLGNSTTVKLERIAPLESSTSEASWELTEYY